MESHQSLPEGLNEAIQEIVGTAKNSFAKSNRSSSCMVDNEIVQSGSRSVS